MYKVSVVVVVYNTEKFIKECFDSIFSQTIDSYEVVVVDNASNEGTRIALENSLAGHENVVHRRMEENVGGATGATIGIGMASGEYLYIMDSDDILPPNALNALYTRAKQDDCDVVIGRSVSLINGKISLMRTTSDEITWAKCLITDSLEKEPQLMVAPFFWGKIFRRSFIVDNSIYMKDGVINADRYMTTNALRLSSKTAVIRDICLIWRRSSIRNKKASITASANDKQEINAICDRMQSLLDTAMLFPEGDLRQYALISNLTRVFIPVKALGNPAIRNTYIEFIKQYLSLLDEQMAFSSLMLPARHKIYEYLARRDRYDEIYRLSLQKNLSIRHKDGKTIETSGILHDIPIEVMQRRTIRSWDKISASAHNNILTVKCTVNDVNLAKADVVSVYFAPSCKETDEDYCIPGSEYSVESGKGIMTFNFSLSEDAVHSLLKKDNSRLFFFTKSGDMVFSSEIKLNLNTLSTLRKAYPNIRSSLFKISVRNKYERSYERLYEAVSVFRRRFS